MGFPSSAINISLLHMAPGTRWGRNGDINILITELESCFCSVLLFLAP